MECCIYRVSDSHDNDRCLLLPFARPLLSISKAQWLTLNSLVTLTRANLAVMSRKLTSMSVCGGGVLVFVMGKKCDIFKIHEWLLEVSCQQLW